MTIIYSEKGNYFIVIKTNFLLLATDLGSSIGKRKEKKSVNFCQAMNNFTFLSYLPL